MSTRCPVPPTVLPALRPGDVLSWTEPLLRIYSSAGPYAVTWNDFRRFGPVSTMRFDHHPPPPRVHSVRGVSYLAGAGPGVDPFEVAVLERFQHGIVDTATGAPRFALWEPRRALRLLDLSGSTWLARAGGNTALMSGARGTARAWARQIYQEYYSDIDGLVWSSSVLPPGRSLVLFEQARSALPASPDSDRPLSEPFLLPALTRICEKYGLDLVT